METLNSVSNYCPMTRYSTEDIEINANNLSDFISNIPPRHDIIIISSDLNAAIELRSCINECNEDKDEEDTINNLIGLHRNPRCNELGNLVIVMLRDLNLQLAPSLIATVNLTCGFTQL